MMFLRNGVIVDAVVKIEDEWMMKQKKKKKKKKKKKS
jgi:hypothetical protein